jgi:hypothetical protein
MPKGLCITGIVIVAVLLLLFGLDLFLGFPFHGASKLMDGAMVVSALILGYLSWAALREQK